MWPKSHLDVQQTHLKGQFIEQKLQFEVWPKPHLDVQQTRLKSKFVEAYTNLKLKTRPEQLSGSLPLYIALPIWVSKLMYGLDFPWVFDFQFFCGNF